VAVADGGNLIEARETLDLALLVTECADIAHAIGEVKHVQVKSSIGARALVSGSRTYLRRLLLDLAQFAIRCSSSPSCVEIRLDASDAEATLTVTCLGCELDPSDISRLFEPFPYINVGTPASATRVGLAVAHGIARAHDGSIRAENEAGRLALVVSLPLARA
jgi:two-component system heavy metal sensor histidine kinase CusS